MAKDHIRFDTTDADTIADSDKILSGIISSDGSTLITDTLEGGKQGLDVYVINANIDVNLQDGAGNDITSTGGALDVNIASGSITVTPESVHAEDAAHVSGDDGSFSLSIRIDDITADNSALLAGTNGDYQGTFTNASGEMYVKSTDTDNLLTTIDSVLDAIAVEQLDQGTTLDSILADTTAILADTASIDANISSLTKLEDSAHVSGDAGVQTLAVRNDTLSSLVDTNGDYAPLQVDASGALYTTISGDITTSDAALANSSIANAVNTLAVANTAEDVVASPLTDRKYLFVYNNDNKKMFIGATGVTAANGFPISPGSYMELRAGAAIDIEYVAADLGHEIRTLELS